MDLWCWVSMVGKDDDLGNFSMISWSIWLNRNDFIFDGRLLAHLEVISRASYLYSQFVNCIPWVALRSSPHVQHSGWITHPSGFLKVNADASVIQGFPRVGIGVVARDEFGVVIQSLFSSVDGIFSVHVAELLAAREGMILVSNLFWKHVILESDASNVVNSLNSISQPADDEPIVSSIRLWGMKFCSFQVLHCRREANEAAHLLVSKDLNGSVFCLV